MSKAEDFVGRFVDVARHLSQGPAGGDGSIHSMQADGDTLVVTMNEGEDGREARRFRLEVTSNRKVAQDPHPTPLEQRGTAEDGPVTSPEGES